MTVKSRKKLKTANRNASDEECIAGAFSIKKSPFFPSQEPEKTAENATPVRQRAERRVYENRAYEAGKDH